MPAVPDPPPGYTAAQRAQRERYPLLSAEPGWQPVHTVYVPADRFSPHTVDEWRDEAFALVKKHLGGPGELAEVFGTPGG
ncbi:MAG TPA: aldolase, partial [Nonomuraea sp.]|nr:aldolase [Nonomuraea sp.]